jgi:hypothetical protein
MDDNVIPIASKKNGKKNGKRSQLEAMAKDLASLARRSPYMLRITRLKECDPPVLIVKERIAPEDRNDARAKRSQRPISVDRGKLHGQLVRQCLPVLKHVVESVCDDSGVPLELERFMTPEGLRLCDVNLPLDEEAGAKLALLFRLQDRISDGDRVELMGRRIDRFSREEAAYWLAKVTTPNKDAQRWAVRGLRILLCGAEGNDPGILPMLEKLRVMA